MSQFFTLLLFKSHNYNMKSNNITRDLSLRVANKYCLRQWQFFNYIRLPKVMKNELSNMFNELMFRSKKITQKVKLVWFQVVSLINKIIIIILIKYFQQNNGSRWFYYYSFIELRCESKVKTGNGYGISLCFPSIWKMLWMTKNFYPYCE